MITSCSEGSFQLVLCRWLIGVALVHSAELSAAPLGDCSLEPQFQSRSDVVLCEPWESPLWWRDHNFSETDRDLLRCESVANSDDKQICLETDTHPAVASSRIVSEVSSSVPCVAGSCVRIDIPQGDTGKFSTKWLFSENTGVQPEQMYLRYYIRFSEGWNPGTCSTGDRGGKLPGLSHSKATRDPGGQCGNGGAIPDDDNHCWSMRAMHKACLDGGKNVCANKPSATYQYGSYLYFPGQQTSTGSNGMWHDGLNHWSSSGGSGGTCQSNPNNVRCGTGDGGMLEPGRWYETEMFVRMNTLGQSDGVVRGWIDGKLSYEKTNMVFRQAGHTEIHVREAWLDVFMGGTIGACDDVQVYLDQMVLATDSRIGPATSAVVPRPPSSLTVE